LAELKEQHKIDSGVSGTGPTLSAANTSKSPARAAAYAHFEIVAGDLTDRRHYLHWYVLTLLATIAKHVATRQLSLLSDNTPDAPPR
jgi:hypothetical protein